jgi:polyphosphate kinase
MTPATISTMYERVEVMFPVKNPVLRERVFGEILQSYLNDTRKPRILRQDGSYIRTCQESANKSDKCNRFSAQDFFIARAEGRSTETPSSTKYLPVERASHEPELAVVA